MGKVCKRRHLYSEPCGWVQLCASEIQDQMANHINFLQNHLNKGKSSKEVSDALKELRDLYAFQRQFGSRGSLDHEVVAVVVILLTTVFQSMPGVAIIINDNHCKDPQIQLDLNVMSQNKSSQNISRTVYLRTAVFYLFGVLCRFQVESFNTVQVISRRVVGRAEETSTYSSSRICTVNCRPTFPLEAMTGIEPWPQRWEARVLPLCHHGP